MKIVLVDLHAVAGFDEGILWYLEHRYPKVQRIGLENRTTYLTEDQYPEEHRAKIRRILEYPGFYQSLPVLSGAVEAIRSLQEVAEVFLVVTPEKKFDHCVEEIYLWTAKNFGLSFTERIIFIEDKTMILGDYLITDCPYVQGKWSFTWEHIILNRPYNREGLNRRLSWTDWGWFAEELRNK